MAITDTNGNECADHELQLIYRLGERCPAIPSITGVLTYPEFIKLVRWCIADQLPPPDLHSARAAFPSLRYRSDERVLACLNFLKGDPEVRSALGGCGCWRGKDIPDGQTVSPCPHCSGPDDHRGLVKTPNEPREWSAYIGRYGGFAV